MFSNNSYFLCLWCDWCFTSNIITMHGYHSPYHDMWDYYYHSLNLIRMSKNCDLLLLWLTENVQIHIFSFECTTKHINFSLYVLLSSCFEHINFSNRIGENHCQVGECKENWYYNRHLYAHINGGSWIG